MYSIAAKAIPSRRAFLLPILFMAMSVYGQPKEAQQLLRLYEDNDAVNFLQKTTDEAYSNGSRIDYFYTKKKQSFFLGLFRHDSGSVNVGGISVMQVMITPRDYSRKDKQPDDYPYSGALYLTKSFFSANPVHKCNLETEIVVGIMGPYAYAGQVQNVIHGMIGNDKAQGWQNQLPTDVLLNVNITGEKQLFHSGKWLEVILGQNTSVGTMLDAASAYSTIRLGKMNPYFNGYFSQFSSHPHKSQIYFIARPSAEIIARNALLQGGMVVAAKHKSENPKIEEEGISPQLVTASVDVGMVAVIGNFSVSVIQKTMTSVLRGLPGHSVGNVSLTFAW